MKARFKENKDRCKKAMRSEKNSILFELNREEVRKKENVELTNMIEMNYSISFDEKNKSFKKYEIFKTLSTRNDIKK